MTPTTAKQITVGYLKDPMKRVIVESVLDHWMKIEIYYPVRMRVDNEPDPTIQKDYEPVMDNVVIFTHIYIESEELINKLELLTFKECKYE